MFSRTSDRYGRVPVLTLSTALLAVSMGLLIVAQTPVIFWTAALLYGFSSGMNSPTVQAWTADLADEATRGRAMATMYIALEAGIGLGALGSGWLLNHIVGDAGITASFAASSFLSLAATGYLGWLWHKDRQLARHRN